jgi:hypothetical protein
MKTQLIAAAAVAVLLAGCKTTQEAAVAVQGKWVGQPVDRFFIANGPPVSEFPLDSGGTIYTWRGGDASYTRPAQIQTVRPATPLVANTVTRTSTYNPAPGTTVTRSSTTSFGISAPAATTVVRPAQRVEIVCEAQITADREGKIVAVRISRDTQGAAFSLSRCAELFAE